jgi:hypothetical protein
MARANPLTPIRFDPSGVSRGFNIPVTVAYDLENCFIDRDGKITQLNTPQAFTPADGAEFQQGKPYFEWNDQLLDAVLTDSGGAIAAITGPIDTYNTFEVFSGDSFAKNLYLSGKATGGTVLATGYFTYTLQPDYDHDTDEDDNISVAPALIHNVMTHRWEDSDYEALDGISATEHSAEGATAEQVVWNTYLLIPYNERGEAGPWHYATEVRNLAVLTRASVATRHLAFTDLFIDCNDQTNYVEIYSTLTYDQEGKSSITFIVAQDGLTIDNELEKWDEGVFTFYHRTRIKPTEVTLEQTRYIAEWTETEYLVAAPLFEQLYLAYSANITSVQELPTGLNYFIHADIRDTYEIAPAYRSPLRILDVSRNLHRTAPPTYSLRRVSGDGVDDQFVKDGAGAGQHQLVLEGDLTSDISVGDYVRIVYEKTNDWFGAYGVTSISFSTGTNKTTIQSDNFTGNPSATLNPVPATVDILYFTQGPDLELYQGFAARTMFNHNGTMIYGNPTIAIPDVKQNVHYIAGSGTSNKYGVLFEYLDANGEIARGPFLAPLTDFDSNTDLVYLQIPWNGEHALQIFKYDGSGGDTLITNYTLYERITPSPEGFFFTSYKTSDGILPKWAFFVGSSPERNDETPVTYKTPGAGYYTLQNVAYMSQTNRPNELTFNNFIAPLNTDIRAIVPARLEEAEGVASYDFIVLTDRTVHVYARDGFVVKEIQRLLNDAGVKQKNFGDIGVGAPDTKHPLVVPFEGGVVFVSTDDRIYIVSGRRITALDTNVRGLFGSTWRDIAYHEQENEIWVVNDESEIWIYSIEDGGWNKNFTLSSNWRIFHLFYSELNQEMLMYLDTDVSGGPTYDTYIFDNGGAALTAGVATQEMSANGRIAKVARVIVDYERDSYSGSNRAKLLHYVDARTDGDNEDILDVLETNSKNRIEYTIPRQKSVYPTLVGKRHQLKVSEFTSLDSILLHLKEQDGFD